MNRCICNLFENPHICPSTQHDCCCKMSKYCRARDYHECSCPTGKTCLAMEDRLHSCICEVSAVKCLSTSHNCVCLSHGPGFCRSVSHPCICYKVFCRNVKCRSLIHKTMWVKFKAQVAALQ